jgi:GntR family transcriptional regulator, rspAB operon transcriptional repressor
MSLKREKSLQREKSAPSRRRQPPAGASRRRTPHLSIRDQAYEAIKDRIITLQFKPGECINEASVSELLGFGRTPVHQAIDRLMLEEMVEVIPRKGVIVKPVSLNEVLQIIEVRLINEPFGARVAAEQANDADLNELADVIARARQWASLRNVENLMLLDREFHFLIARATKNDVMSELLRNLHERSLRFWFLSLNAPKQYETVQDEHAAILGAIRKRDPDKAEAAMLRHIESFRTSVTQFL